GYSLIYLVISDYLKPFMKTKIFILKLRWTYFMYQSQKWTTICAVKLKQLILESFMVLVIMDYPKIYKYLEKRQTRSLINTLKFILIRKLIRLRLYKKRIMTVMYPR